MNKPLQAALDESTRCIQCGFCLPTCPTYRVFGEEKHSPRGRIQLVKSWAEGKTEVDASLQTALDVCLDCRACETACPIDVKYGTILTGARDELARRSTDPTTSTPMQRARDSMFRGVLRHVVSRPRRMRMAARFTRIALSSRPGKWLQQTVTTRRPDSWMAGAMTFARGLPSPGNGSVSAAYRAEAGGQPKAALFLGCAQEGMFPETNSATAQLLEQAGFHVSIPSDQGCCGALHRHHGDKDYARTLVLRNLHAFGAFEDDGPDVVVMNAGGCMAWVKEAAELFAPGSPEHRAAEKLAERTVDISQVLHDNGDKVVSGVEPGPRVVYQPSCHLRHVCGVSDQPMAVLQRITGGNTVLPADGGSCCGSAGIYNALQPHESRAILERKMEAIAAADPDVIVTSNPGCHLQMLAGVEMCGLKDKVRVMQLADFVNDRTKNQTKDQPSD